LITYCKKQIVTLIQYTCFQSVINTIHDLHFMVNIILTHNSIFPMLNM
jgi:hypothetical protein